MASDRATQTCADDTPRHVMSGAADRDNSFKAPAPAAAPVVHSQSADRLANPAARGNGASAGASSLRAPGNAGAMLAVPRAPSSGLMPPPSASSSLRVNGSVVSANGGRSNGSMSSVGSATGSAEDGAIKGVGSGRSKIPLAPGHSPLDWARLSHDASLKAQRRLRGTALADGRYVKITPAMLARCRESARALRQYRRRRAAAAAAGADEEEVEEADAVDGAIDDGQATPPASTPTDSNGNITTSAAGQEEEEPDLDEIPLWTALRGKVYNLTAYLDFHPGGGGILLNSAVGRDCTGLFDKYHSWVNADALLEACLIGPLVAEGADGGTRAVRADRVA